MVSYYVFCKFNFKENFMSERKIIRLFLLAFLLMTLFFLNPSREQHIDKLKVKFDDEYGADQGNDDAFGNRFEYHDYYLFSTTTDNVSSEHERTSVGLLGFVF
jgi:hypothetical protein